MLCMLYPEACPTGNFANLAYSTEIEFAIGSDLV